MQEAVDIFTSYLEKSGQKNTPERQSILEGVFKVHEHFTVDTLYDFMKDKFKNVSRASIYRTLPLLVKSGLVQETVNRDGKAWYEHTFGHAHHDHLFCISCGNVIEFTKPDIEKMQEKVCSEYKFKEISHKLCVYGLCEKCQKDKSRK